MNMNPDVSRRTVLGGAAAGLGTALFGGLTSNASASSLADMALKPSRTFGYGPLIPDPRGLLDLPRGFHYKVLAVSGNSGNPIPATTLSDGGELSPSRYDGTGSFPTDQGWNLIANHENGDGVSYPVAAPVPHREGLTYDPGVYGGTTTISVDFDGNRLGEVVSLAGTYSNCAGGKTPWGTWLTCEETTAKAGGTLQKDHGYVFEVHPTDMSRNRDPQPIKAFGRFAHEGIVVDPTAGTVYMTEDTKGPDGLLYAWAPGGAAPTDGYRGLAADAGTLSAMRCTDASGNHVPNLNVARELGTTYSVSWVEVPDRDARTTDTRLQLSDDQITRSHKLEGAWWGDGGFYFDASYDKAFHDGQIWFFDVAKQTITLKSFYPLTADQDVDPDGPDNLTVNPYGGLVLCEDGDGVNHLVLDDLKGHWAFFARNRQDSEMAGANFSSDAKFLFANSQDPGVVFGIHGPWKRRG